MLHTLLSIVLIFFVVYGIEGFGKCLLKINAIEKNILTEKFHLSGVNPGNIFVRVNETFKIDCSVRRANGELNFYDGDELVPGSYVNVIIKVSFIGQFF